MSLWIRYGFFGEEVWYAPGIRSWIVVWDREQQRYRLSSDLNYYERRGESA